MDLRSREVFLTTDGFGTRENIAHENVKEHLKRLFFFYSSEGRYSPLIAAAMVTAMMRFTAVITAGVSFSAMLMVVVVALDLGVEV